ncbi:hypothetical protein V6N13_045614 [Hibiscus sabdariffa]|uniref:Uncharacterized protein n=1 Tax=Hibiscus sabdariffa TaxID=183260 RepID=A0ABR2RLJ5_9ROSI
MGYQIPKCPNSPNEEGRSIGCFCFPPLRVSPNMRIKSSESGPSNSLCRTPKPSYMNIRVPRLSRWRRLRKKKMVKRDDMERKNMKLYMENQSILKQNEALRNKALLLHQENLTLLAQLSSAAKTTSLSLIIKITCKMDT